MRPDQPIDVIVPVYRGRVETLAALESVLASVQRRPFELVVVNDASPEPELTGDLRRLASRDSRLTLIENPENRGFVRSVNRGMALHPTRDVVLLNSDAQVANDWLDRLAEAAWTANRIATVTPFSNNATLASYPRFGETNPLVPEYSLAALDSLFRQANARQTVDVPTGVGFCMYVRRDCLRTVGPFNAEVFGLGYGEENDFCRRASKAGWRNLLAGDVFVYHRGEVSFGPGHEVRKAEAMNRLLAIHPDYTELVQAHFAADPARPLRLAVDAARIARSSRANLLFITHGRGGGTERHVGELAERFTHRANVLVLRARPWGAELTWDRAGESFALHFRLPGEADSLYNVVRQLRIDRVHVHHLIDFHPCLYSLLQRIQRPYDFTVHDYYSFCPRISLSGTDGRYCGEPDEAGCNRCLSAPPATSAIDIHHWRSQYATVLVKAERVFAPTIQAASRLVRHFPHVRAIATPHLDSQPACSYPVPNPPLVDPDEPLRIVALGALSEIKGLLVLHAATEDARDRRLPLRLRLIGAPNPQYPQNAYLSVDCRGEYRDAELAAILREERPHAVWFPVQWPETYSYTLSTALEWGLPIVSSDLGANAERLAGREWTWLLPWDTSAAAWNDHFVTIRSKHFLTGMAPPRSEVAVPGYAFSYDGDYLVTPAGEPPHRLLDPPSLAGLCRQPGVVEPLGIRTIRRVARHPFVRPLVRRIPARLKHDLRRLLGAA